MYSSVCTDDRNVFALKSSNRCSRDYDGGMNGSPDRAIARLVCKDRAVDYWMRKSRITVGRSSSKRSSADVDMGQSTFISRNHLEIYTTDARFYALVTGKNGLFVDDIFHKKGGSAFELPNTCLLRFPSTEIKIHFEVLLPEMPSNMDVKPYVCQDPQPIQTSVALKSNSYGEIYSTSNSNFNALDGVLYPVKEEIVDHVMAADFGDIGKFEQPSPDYAYMVPDNQVKEEKEAAPPPPQKPIPAQTAPSSLTNEHTKPPYSYAQLIVQAITSQPDRQLTLSGIYNHITKQYPFYRHGDKGWQNSIRHNLSLNRYFVKVPRAQEEAGKGCFWRIDANSESALMSQAFKRRRQRQAPYCKTNSETLQSPGLNTSDSNTVIGTPDDSCASWEGPHTNGEDLEAQPGSQPPEQMTQASEGTIRCFSSVNKPSYNAVSYAAVNLLASHLPTSMSKSYVFAKPLPVPSAPNNPDQVCSTPQSPIIISSHSNGSLSTQEIYTNTTGDVSKVISESQDGKSKMLPLQIMSQPKTFILRSTPTNSLNFSMPAGSQLIKLSYAPQTGTSKQVAPDQSPRAPVDQNGENEANHATENLADGSVQGETMTRTKADASLAQTL